MIAYDNKGCPIKVGDKVKAKPNNGYLITTNKLKYPMVVLRIINASTILVAVDNKEQVSGVRQFDVRSSGFYVIGKYIDRKVTLV